MRPRLASPTTALVLGGLWLVIVVSAVKDRRFNRARYDAEEVVDAFTRTLRDAIELDTVSGRLADVVERTVHPAHVSLWIRGPRPPVGG